jgi:oligoendopeptidase F
MSATVSEQRDETEALGDLPVWDLSDLYGGPDAPELKADLKRAAAEAKAFQGEFQNQLAALEGDTLAAAIARYEAIEEVLGRVMSYAQLVHADDMSDAEAGRFYQNMQERTTEISTALLFFTLELNRLDEAELEAKLASEALARYRPWLRDIRAFRDHQLSDELESLLHEKQVAGRSAWIRLFDETMADLRFDFEGESLTATEVPSP